MVSISFSQNLNNIDLSKNIPVDYRGDSNYEHIETLKEFSEKYQATLVVKGYVLNNKTKLVSIELTGKDLSKAEKLLAEPGGCPDGYRDCARNCTDKPTMLGLGLCTIYCMIDCSGN